jgi:hypothetical protein
VGDVAIIPSVFENFADFLIRDNILYALRYQNFFQTIGIALPV